MLPFCDLVVLSTNSTIGILMNNVLSVIYLGERVVWAYDIVAIVLIITGSLTIVGLSNYDTTTYTPDDIRALLFSMRTYIFTTVLVVFTVLTVIQYTWHRKKLYNFNRLANVWLDKQFE